MTTLLKGIIQDMHNTGELIDFYSFEPPQKSRNAVYDDVSVRGRSEPHVFYSHTEAPTYQFSIRLVASYDQRDSGTTRSVKEKEYFIESLVMPDYGPLPSSRNSVVAPPHLARIRIKKLIDIAGTIRNTNYVYLPPYDEEGYPQLIEVTFSFHVQRIFGQQEPLGFAEVRRLLWRGQGLASG